MRKMTAFALSPVKKVLDSLAAEQQKTMNFDSCYKILTFGNQC